MSAFVVDTEHIRVLVHAIVERELRVEVPSGTLHSVPVHDPRSGLIAGTTLAPVTLLTASEETAPLIGQLLLSENVASVNYRYSTDDIAVYDHAAPARSGHTPAEIAKAAAGFGYQCNEHPEWPASVAKRLLDALAWDLVTELPGYDDAERMILDD